MMMNELSQLEKWLTENCGLTHYVLEPLAGDASFRRYFRLQHAAGSYVVMDASAEKHTCLPFMTLAKGLRAQGLQTPAIIASDLTQGFLLLTDFGDRLYLHALNLTNAQPLYTRALDALAVLQQCYPLAGWAPQFFTQEVMRKELELFKEWFLEKHLNLALSSQTQQMLTNCFVSLTESAALQPQVFMHRDYHSANLMLLSDNQLGILDFQDAFIGPVTYDLVSLLRDCYIAWPEKLVQTLVLYYWEKLALPQVSSTEFLRWFDFMGLQRHLKALATFARKYRRDNNPNYLQHIPRTLNYILTVSARYSEYQPLNYFFQEMVLEKCVE